MSALLGHAKAHDALSAAYDRLLGQTREAEIIPFIKVQRDAHRMAAEALREEARREATGNG